MAVGVLGGSFSAVAGQCATGEVLTSQRYANLVATMINAYAFKSATRVLWVNPSQCESIAGQWVFQEDSPPYWQATATGDDLVVPVPVFYTTSGTVAQQVTSVAFRMKPANTGAVTCLVRQLTNLGNTSTPSFALLGTGTSDGTANEQTVTVGSLTAQSLSSGYLYCKISAGQAVDRVYAVGVTYNNSLYV